MLFKNIPIQTALFLIMILLAMMAVSLITIALVLIALRKRGLVLASASQMVQAGHSHPTLHTAHLSQTGLTPANVATLTGKGTKGKKGDTGDNVKTPLDSKGTQAEDPSVIIIEEKAGINWPFWGLVVSIILIILFSGGYYTYYLGQQRASIESYAKKSAEESPGVDSLTKNVERAKQAVADQETNNSNEVETKDWQSYQNPSYLYSFLHPKDWKLTDYQRDWGLTPAPTNTSQVIRITKVDGAVTATPATDATDEVATPITGANSYLQIWVMPNKDKLEPGAFASIYPAHDLGNIKSRAAMQMYGLPAVRYITGDDTNKQEVVYVNLPNSDVMYAITLKVPTNASQDSADYRVFKKMITILKLQ
jgi:hypothetical protein